MRLTQEEKGDILCGRNGKVRLNLSKKTMREVYYEYHSF